MLYFYYYDIVLKMLIIYSHNIKIDNYFSNSIKTVYLKILRNNFILFNL